MGLPKLGSRAGSKWGQPGYSRLRILEGVLTILGRVCWKGKGTHSPGVQILREGEAAWKSAGPILEAL